MSFTDLLLRLATFVIRLRLQEEKQVLEGKQNENNGLYFCLDGGRGDVDAAYCGLDGLRDHKRLARAIWSGSSGSDTRTADDVRQTEITYDA